MTPLEVVCMVGLTHSLLYLLDTLLRTLPATALPYTRTLRTLGLEVGLGYTVLCCALLYCTVLYCTVLYCTVLY